jgi:hypothetical protein
MPNFVGCIPGRVLDTGVLALSATAVTPVELPAATDLRGFIDMFNALNAL